MRILFFMRSTVYVRNFESTLRLLAERGHEVHVVADTHTQVDPGNLMGRLAAQYPGITHSEAPDFPVNGWSLLGIELRRGLDYLRYLQPDYERAPKLRKRALKTAPPFVTHALERPLVNTPTGRRLFAAVLRACDRALPRNPAVDAFVRSHRPDLVAVTPLVEPGSPQSEYLRSARALGVRTALCVYSWDNLTNKGLIHDPVDVVTVWNDAMKQEAVRLHRVPAERVVVTGSGAYDHWFTWQPREDRQAFCARVGLDASQPYILYVCSSRFIAPDETPFVRKWIESIRRQSPRLRTAGVLVRPHPQNASRWNEVDLSDLGNVAVWPRAGANPADTESRAEYFDSIHHSACVVGVNTSAQIESAIVGRTVHTWLAPEFRDTQEGTLHFRHLRENAGGLLQVAETIEQHAEQLEAAMLDPTAHADQCRRFIETFVRPYGLHEPAAPRIVAALEHTAARRKRASTDRGPWWRLIVRPALRQSADRLAAAEQAGKPEGSRRRRKDKAPRTAFATPDEAFNRYRTVRDALAPIRTLQGPVSPAEERMLASLQGLWDASPDMIATVRHYGHAMTGVTPGHYDAANVSLRERVARDLRRLLAKGYPALCVDEPRALGAFGIEGNGHFFNEDTVRFFRVLTVLQDAALLNDFRTPASSGRQTVWEIGGGWGGFAYQFKTVCPQATYLITGPPETLLLSSVYLSAVLPQAALRFFDRANPDMFWHDWDHVDFAFLPEWEIGRMRPGSVHLTVDLMALERMTAARVDEHVRRAYGLDIRHFFSLCTPPNGAPGIPDVAAAVERWYWRHPVSAPSFVKWRLALRSDSADTADRTFLLGWRRLHACA